MNRLFLIAALVLGITLALPGCSDDTGPGSGTTLPCSCTGETTPDCKDECPKADNPENVGKALSALSLSASAFYSIAYASGYGPSSATYCNDPGSSTWCECNVVYSDNASRCNEPTATTLWEFPAPACVVSKAILSYTLSASYNGHSVDVRRILRPVTTPPMGIAGSCVTSSVASWWRSGSQAWTIGGAKDDGTDRTVAAGERGHFVSGVWAALPGPLTVTAPHTEWFDVTTLVQGCPSTGACVLAQYADAHVYVHTGATLDITCGAASVCGDDITEGSETCDDGNTTAGDGCSASCAVETGWSCSGSPSACATTCGDGIAAGTEACDDGNAVSTDGCVACVLATCGDGLVRAGVEQCDDGNASNTDACLTTCVSATCGDGFVGPGEDCDDANAIATDACINCVAAACGDGFVGPGEACDDGNLTSGDGCSASCVAEVCTCE